MDLLLFGHGRDKAYGLLLLYDHKLNVLFCGLGRVKKRDFLVVDDDVGFSFNKEKNYEVDPRKNYCLWFKVEILL